MQELETEAEVSERIGISAATLRQWRWLDKGPAYIKVGRLVKYQRRDVDRWLASHTVTPAGTDAA